VPPDAQALLEAGLRAAHAGDWPAYRAHLLELRDAWAALIERDEDVRQQFEMLGAAAPPYDPEGCVTACEALAALLSGRPADAPGAAREPPPALDLRGLQPPEPIVRILEALERAPRVPLRAILPHEPVPLYALLRERGFTCSGAPRADGGFEVLIERA
jgi:Uncharacterized conserved protein (DUF2249)